MTEIQCPAPKCDRILKLHDDPPPTKGLRGICPRCLGEYEVADADPLTLVPIVTENSVST